MNITRRQFLQYCTASAAALGLSQTDLLKLDKALAATVCGCNDHGAPHVIWFQGQSCGGCTLSILNRMKLADEAVPELGVVQDVVDLLVGDAVGALTTGVRPGWANFPDGYITLDYQSEVMAGAGDIMADYIECLRDSGTPYIVALSGAIPLMDIVLLNSGMQPACVSGSFDTGDVLGLGRTGRIERSILEIMEWLATGPGCIAMLAFGTCASYGGIPGAKGNVTGATGLYNALVNYRGLGGFTFDFGGSIGPVPLSSRIVNCPGCAPHPDWMIYPAAWAYLFLHGARPTPLPPLDTDPVVTPVYRGLTQVSANSVPKNRARAIYTGDKGYEVFCEVCPKYSITKLCTDLGAGLGNGDGTHQKEYCTRPVGCNGFIASPDCPTRNWNNFDDGTHNQWCVGTLPMGSNYVCQGCAEPDFPDGRSPFFSSDKDGS